MKLLQCLPCHICIHGTFSAGMNLYGAHAVSLHLLGIYRGVNIRLHHPHPVPVL